MTGPVWMLRINPMVRRRLADPALAELVEQAAALEPATASLAAAASDDLYRLIPTAPEHLRGPLLALRRSIHNDRDHAGPLDGALDLPASVTRWSDHRRLRLACDADIAGAHEGALARERSLLRERLGEGNFLTTLAQSASGVYDAACRYRRPAGTTGPGADALDSRDRKAERSLVQFLTRAMVRTSPYGRFTAVGLARLDPAGVAMDEASAATAKAHLDVDRPMFDFVMGGLVPADGDALLAMPPTARVSDDRITFFQVGAEGIRRLAAPMNPPTRLLVELLQLGPCRRSALAAAMCDRLALGRGGRRSGWSAWRCGSAFVVTAWRGDEFLADPVDEAVGELPGSQCPPPVPYRPRPARGGRASPVVGERIARRAGASDTVGGELSRLARTAGQADRQRGLRPRPAARRPHPVPPRPRRPGRGHRPAVHLRPHARGAGPGGRGPGRTFRSRLPGAPGRARRMAGAGRLRRRGRPGRAARRPARTHRWIAGDAGQDPSGGAGRPAARPVLGGPAGGQPGSPAQAISASRRPAGRPRR